MLELGNDKLDAFTQPKNPLVDIYVKDKLVFPAIQKQDHEIFALDAITDLANVFKKLGERASQLIIISRISIVNLSMDPLEDIKTSYNFYKQYYYKK